MNEHPILFSGPMVRAILKGRKTQTRRVIQPKPDHFHTFQPGIWLPQIGDKEIKCSYGEPGDRLWVREAWLQDGGIYLYRADFGLGVLADSWNGYWKPSIHMPKEAARIWLKAMNVRVERLQDITPKDAENEGVGNLFYEDIGYSEKNYGTEVDKEYGIAREQFVWLWESTIKKSELDRYGWKANPWVWVIEFERCDKPEGR